jgi:hypothetical protein
MQPTGLVPQWGPNGAIGMPRVCFCKYLEIRYLLVSVKCMYRICNKKWKPNWQDLWKTVGGSRGREQDWNEFSIESQDQDIKNAPGLSR